MAAATDQSNGFALIVVLWFLVLLSAIGIYMMANGRSETALAHNLLAAARAEAVADAAIAQVVFNETDPDPRNRWKIDGLPHRLILSGGYATVSLFDETQKINPNLASNSLMAGLFQALGTDATKAARLGAAVGDWVSSGDKPSPLGAKKEQYQQAGKSYGPPDAPLETLDDLQLVLGMTPQIYATAQPYLTIFTDTDAPADLSGAPLPVVVAVRLAAHTDSADDNSATPPTDNGTAPASGSGGQPNAPTAATPDVIIAIEETAHSADGGVFARHIVIRLDRGNPKGYAVLDWRRADLQ